jgi:hypothetical protein
MVMGSRRFLGSRLFFIGRWSHFTTAGCIVCARVLHAASAFAELTTHVGALYLFGGISSGASLLKPLVLPSVLSYFYFLKDKSNE